MINASKKTIFIHFLQGENHNLILVGDFIIIYTESPIQIECQRFLSTLVNILGDNNLSWWIIQPWKSTSWNDFTTDFDSCINPRLKCNNQRILWLTLALNTGFIFYCLAVQGTNQAHKTAFILTSVKDFDKLQ